MRAFMILSLVFSAMVANAGTISASDLCREVNKAAKPCTNKHGPSCIMGALRKKQIISGQHSFRAAADSGPALKGYGFKDTLKNSTDLLEDPSNIEDGSVIVLGKVQKPGCPSGRQYGQLGVKCYGDKVVTLNNGKAVVTPLSRALKVEGCVTGVYNHKNIKASGSSSGGGGSTDSGESGSDGEK